MAIIHEARQRFTFAGRNIVIELDDTTDASATKSRLKLVNFQLESGASEKGKSDVILSRMRPTACKMNFRVDYDVVRYYRRIKKRDVKCKVIEDGIPIFNGWIQTGGFKNKYNALTQVPLKLVATDGFQDLNRTIFTPDDYAAFADPQGIRQYGEYSATGNYMLMADFISEAILKAQGVRRAYGVAANLSNFNSGTGAQYANFAEVIANTAIPVRQLYGKYWGVIFDWICQQWNLRWSTYREDYCLVSVPLLAQSSYQLYAINQDGRPSNPAASITINPLALNERKIYWESNDEGTDILDTVNVNSYRGGNTGLADLTQDELVNGDITLTGPDNAVGWGRNRSGRNVRRLFFCQYGRLPDNRRRRPNRWQYKRPSVRIQHHHNAGYDQP